MKRSLLLVLLMTLCSLGLRAQSSMTDLQVMQFVLKEYKAGTSQAQIVTKLMQRGVDIQQIRRVKDAYERVNKNKGLGQVSNSTDKNELLEDSRMRKNNGESKGGGKGNFMFNGGTQNGRSLSGFGQNTGSQKQMYQELNGFIPDTTASHEPGSLQVDLGKIPRKVFGRDIFNRRDLSFEPNMNIATPQNYRLGMRLILTSMAHRRSRNRQLSRPMAT